MTRAEKLRRAAEKDFRVTGSKIPVKHHKPVKRTISALKPLLSGKRTTLGDLIDRALARWDAVRA
jgi:hypothetical protein